MYTKFFKRFFDVLFSLLALSVLSPIIILVAIILLFANKGAGVFFLQERLGKEEQPFNIIKFKSMTDEKDKSGNLLPSKDRVTKIGRFIRATSIDELPQLFNVLIGDMSVIGPRPLFARYGPYYTDRERIRHKVRPGITGLSQISGRNNLSLVKRLEIDVKYVENLSFKTDLQIFIKTLVKVIKSENVVSLPDPTKSIPLDILRKDFVKHNSHIN